MRRQRVPKRAADGHGVVAQLAVHHVDPDDAADPEAFYYRSDHYSYAAKGVPIAFFFTGTHPDYHRNSDSVDKIHFDKMAHVAQLAYRTGFDIANRQQALARDNKGPRAGKGWTGTIK